VSEPPHKNRMSYVRLCAHVDVSTHRFSHRQKTRKKRDTAIDHIRRSISFQLHVCVSLLPLLSPLSLHRLPAIPFSLQCARATGAVSQLLLRRHHTLFLLPFSFEARGAGKMAPAPDDRRVRRARGRAKDTRRRVIKGMNRTPKERRERKGGHLKEGCARKCEEMPRKRKK
jgi:hypothetical protein